MKNASAKAISALIIATSLLSFAAVLPRMTWAQQPAVPSPEDPSILPYFSVYPPTYTASTVGEVFNISVLVNNLDAGWQAIGFQFKLSYNDSLLNVTNVYEGPWLPPFAAPPNGGTFFVTVPGANYTAAADIVLPDVNGTSHAPFPSGTGVLAIFEFNATMRGSFPSVLNCSLHLSETLIVDWNNTIIAEDPSMDGEYLIGAHDVAVTDVTASQAWVYQGFSIDINVTVLNEGDFDENVSVTLYYNMTANEIIGTQNVTLSPLQNQTTTFTWNTIGVPYPHNYTITGVATIPKDINLTDNTLAGGTVEVRIPGDINGDGIVDIYDAIVFGSYFGLQLGENGWNPNADLNNDGKIDIFDMVIVGSYFGKSGSP